MSMFKKTKTLTPEQKHLLLGAVRRGSAIGELTSIPQWTEHYAPIVAELREFYLTCAKVSEDPVAVARFVASVAAIDRIEEKLTEAIESGRKAGHELQTKRTEE
jgi:hypothetical protein